MWVGVFCIDPAMNWGRFQDGEPTFAPRQMEWTPAPSMSQNAGETGREPDVHTDNTQASERLSDRLSETVSLFVI